MEKTKGVIDRFEGDVAIVEVGEEMKEIPKSSLPSDASVGDVLIIENDEIKLDKQESKKLRKEIEQLMDDVWED